MEEAERVAARISASLAFFIKKEHPEGYQAPPDGSPAQAQRMIDITPGMTFDDLRPGEDVGVIQSNRPNTALNIWRAGQLRSSCAGTRSQYSSVARDYDGTYSAQRQELVEGWKASPCCRMSLWPTGRALSFGIGCWLKPCAAKTLSSCLPSWI